MRVTVRLAQDFLLKYIWYEQGMRVAKLEDLTSINFTDWSSGTGCFLQFFRQILAYLLLRPPNLQSYWFTYAKTETREFPLLLWWWTARNTLPMKSTRIHSSSSFSLNSGSWLEEVLTSPTSILFSLWNIVKARLRLWRDVFTAEISKHCLQSAWWHDRRLKCTRCLFNLGESKRSRYP